jgi:hypothetical protein
MRRRDDHSVRARFIGIRLRGLPSVMSLAHVSGFHP